MANSDAAFGFRPVSKDGSPYSGGTFRCSIAAADTTATFIGDAVTIDGSSTGGYPGVTQSAAGDDVYGVVTAFEADPATSLDDQYRKASTLRYCQVASVINTEFEVQDNGSLLAASSGLNAAFIVGTGNTAYGTSHMEADSGTEATTNTLDLQLVRPVDREDSDASLANSKWIVRFNTPSQAQNSVTGRTGVA
jgi:hypothetical protein